MKKKKKIKRKYFTPLIGGIYAMKDLMKTVKEDKKEWEKKRRKNRR